MIPDAQDRETGGTLHDLQVLPHEGVYFGFLGLCHRYRLPKPDSGSGTEDVEVHTGRDEAECEDVQFAFSRDGVRWIRVGDREPFLGFDVPFNRTREWIQIFQPPLIVGDEVWFYYSGVESVFAPNPTAFVREGSGPGDMASCDLAIGLARLRRDGFMSIEPAAEEGFLTTKPFKFDGSRLEVNAEAGAGELAVEILTYDNRYRTVSVTPADGFTMDDCVGFTGDDVRHTMAWRGGPDLTGLRGRTIQLRFRLRRVKLYAFQFTA